MDHRTHVSRDAVDTAFGFLTLQGAESPSLAEGQETHGTKRTQVTWTLLWRVFFFFNADCRSSQGFPGGSVVKKPPANAGDVGFIPWLGQSPGEENGNLV